MIGVALRAVLRVGHRCVQPLSAGDLIVDIGMTLHTAVGVRTLKWRMAQVALRLEIGVRDKTGKDNVVWMFRAERTGIERRAAANQKNADEANHEYERRPAAEEPSPR